MTKARLTEELIIGVLPEHEAGGSARISAASTRCRKARVSARKAKQLARSSAHIVDDAMKDFEL